MSMPKVPPPCGGNVGRPSVQAKASTAPRAPTVPAPCGGRVGTVQAKAGAGPRIPRVPAPCGGNVAGAQLKARTAPARVPPVPAPAGGNVVRSSPVQPKAAFHRTTWPVAPHHANAGPTALQPKMGVGAVVQRASESKLTLQDLMDEAMAKGDWDAYDEIVAKAEAQHGKMGDKFVGKSDADDDWIPSNIGVRPAKPGALWASVYGGGTVSSGKYRVNCKEKKHTIGTVAIVMDNASKKEDGVGKRPPVCHVIPYNHLFKAWQGIMTRGTYTGPKTGTVGYEDAHRDLAWGDPTNLQPGHTLCNSQTAAHATGDPPQRAITYVEQWAKKNGWLP